MKILMINTFEGGAGQAFLDACEEYKKDNEVDLLDTKNLPTKNRKIKFIIGNSIWMFYALIRQLIKKYDLVISNNFMVIPIGLNLKCKYKVVIHHPFYFDMKLNKEKYGKNTKKEFLFLLREKFIILFCKNILTDSEFSRKKLLELYPKINCELFKIPINPIFEKTKNKFKNIKKNNVIFLPILYREDRKGGDFITPVLIKFAPEIKKRKIKIIITGKIVKTQKENYNLLSKHCDVKSLGNISIEEVAKLYSTSLVVLTPAKYEGYGLIPLEVQAAGGKCISAPFPSLGFDNVSVNNPKRKVVMGEITVLEHDADLWEREIKMMV